MRIPPDSQVFHDDNNKVKKKPKILVKLKDEIGRSKYGRIFKVVYI